MKKLSLILISITLLISGIALFFSIRTPKIAYVQNSKLISEFEGFKKGQQDYNQKLKTWQRNLDSLITDYKQNISEFKNNKSKSSSKEIELQTQLINRQEQDIKSYKSALEQKVATEENNINSGVISQVNAFVKKYGEENHYDYILGVTDNGSILYAKENKDITEEVLKYINKKYKGQ